MIETLCGKELPTQVGVNIHEATCRECRRVYEQLQGPPKKIRLTPDDVFAKSAAPALVPSRSQKKSHRKNNERFHRMCLATKGRAKVNRAMHHGWKPKSSVRLDSEHQR